MPVAGGLSVVVMHGAVAPGAPLDEQDTLVQAQGVMRALTALGHRPRALPLTLDLGAARSELEASRPDLVFNLVEAIDGRGSLIHFGVGLAEALGLPVTGAATGGLLNTSHKTLAKRLLALAGLPTPAWLTPDAGAPADGEGRWIVKSVWEHGSIGIDEDSIVDGAHAALEQLSRRAQERGGEWYAERFVAGRELNVALLAGPGGPQVLPIGEILFEDWPAGKPRIVGYAAKWHEGSFEYGHTPRIFDFPPEDEALLGDVRRIALACWRLFDLRGHARVDFRVDEAGRPWVLEVNANPCISPEAGFAAMAEEAGIGYDEVVGRIVADAFSGAAAIRGDTTPTGEARAGLPRRPPAQRLPDVRFRETLFPSDLESVRSLVAATGFFSEEEVAIAVELVDERLRRGPVSGYEFVLAEDSGELVGYSCYGRVSGTAASWDLYWIAVAPGRQGHGLGALLLSRTEALVGSAGGGTLYAETSSRGQYRPTRGFYESMGFVQAAYLPGFYGPGDGKVVYSKVVTPD